MAYAELFLSEMPSRSLPEASMNPSWRLPEHSRKLPEASREPPETLFACFLWRPPIHVFITFALRAFPTVASLNKKDAPIYLYKWLVVLVVGRVDGFAAAAKIIICKVDQGLSKIY